MAEPEQRFQKRQTAYKIRIKDILNSKYTKTEGFDPNYLEVNGREVSRINIIGVIIEKSEINNYKTLTLDDGTGRISARVFENNMSLDKINVNDIVLIIGRPREFSSEKYILIEAIKNIDSAWAKVRKLELRDNLREDAIKKENNKIVSGKPSIEERVVDLDPRNIIFKLVKDLDKGEGVSAEQLSSRNIKDMDKVINILLKEGDIFEIKPGKLKVLE